MNNLEMIHSSRDKVGITQNELARRLDMSSQALSQQLKSDKFSHEQLEKIAKALGAEYISYFRFPNDESVGLHLTEDEKYILNLYRLLSENDKIKFEGILEYKLSEESRI